MLLIVAITTIVMSIFEGVLLVTPGAMPVAKDSVIRWSRRIIGAGLVGLSIGKIMLLADQMWLDPLIESATFVTVLGYGLSIVAIYRQRCEDQDVG